MSEREPEAVQAIPISGRKEGFGIVERVFVLSASSDRKEREGTAAPTYGSRRWLHMCIYV